MCVCSASAGSGDRVAGAASGGIGAIVFDLDGTLYVAPEFAARIQEEAVAYMAGVKGILHEDARDLMAVTRARLQGETGLQPTLSAVCRSLGGDVAALHRHFSATLRPESYLKRDMRVVELLERLAERCRLYVYTNNNRVLTTRIIGCLGLDGLFEDVFAIDDSWRSKPDEAGLERILEATGLEPDRVLFVGDRYDVDLRLPEQKGCPVYLIQNIEQLLRLDSLINKTNSSAIQ